MPTTNLEGRRKLRRMKLSSIEHAEELSSSLLLALSPVHFALTQVGTSLFFNNPGLTGVPFPLTSQAWGRGHKAEVENHRAQNASQCPSLGIGIHRYKAPSILTFRDHAQQKPQRPALRNAIERSELAMPTTLTKRVGSCYWLLLQEQDMLSQC